MAFVFGKQSKLPDSRIKALPVPAAGFKQGLKTGYEFIVGGLGAKPALLARATQPSYPAKPPHELLSCA